MATAVPTKDPCRLCPPGTYQSKSCNGTVSRQCTACPSGTYNRSDNRRSRCRPCSSKTCTRHEVVVTKCSATSDAVCKCGSRAFFDRGLFFCMKCTRCIKGLGVKKSCGRYHDTVCEKCAPGFFSDKKNSKQKCQPCTVCSSCSKIIQECTSKRDTVCDACPTPPSTASSIIPIMSVSTLSPTLKTTTSRSQQTFAGTTGIVDDGKFPNTVIIVLAAFVILVLTLLILVGIYFVCKKCSRWRERQKFPPPTLPVNKGKSVEITEQMQDKMFRDVPYSVVDILAEHLNPDSKNDWRKLANALGMSQLRIANLKLERNNATQGLLQEWGYSENASTRTLYNALISISRKELARFIEPYILKEVVDAT